MKSKYLLLAVWVIIYYSIIGFCIMGVGYVVRGLMPLQIVFALAIGWWLKNELFGAIALIRRYGKELR